MIIFRIKGTVHCFPPSKTPPCIFLLGSISPFWNKVRCLSAISTLTQFNPCLICDATHCFNVPRERSRPQRTLCVAPLPVCYFHSPSPTCCDLAGVSLFSHTRAHHRSSLFKKIHLSITIIFMDYSQSFQNNKFSIALPLPSSPRSQFPSTFPEKLINRCLFRYCDLVVIYMAMFFHKCSEPCSYGQLRFVRAPHFSVRPNPD